MSDPSADVRIETDSFGPLEVPAESLETSPRTRG